jgi:hypothetical protein
VLIAPQFNRLAAVHLARGTATHALMPDLECINGDGEDVGSTARAAPIKQDKETRMTGTMRKGFLCWAAAAAALLSMTWATTARANDEGGDRALRAAIEHAERHAPPGRRPIVETHIHFWQVTRPGGVPWPTPAEGPIFRDVLPPEYTAIARANGIVTAGIVEASGIVEDNQWILDLVRHQPF